jgi:hypothetical protein
VTLPALVRGGKLNDAVTVADIGPGGMVCGAAPYAEVGDAVEIVIDDVELALTYRFQGPRAVAARGRRRLRARLRVDRDAGAPAPRPLAGPPIRRWPSWRRDRPMVASTAMRAVLAIAVVGLAGCFTNALSNANKSKQIQREALEDALPATLEVPEPLPGTGRTARVRVWAAEDYRTQHVPVAGADRGGARRRQPVPGAGGRHQARGRGDRAVGGIDRRSRTGRAPDRAGHPRPRRRRRLGHRLRLRAVLGRGQLRPARDGAARSGAT